MENGPVIAGNWKMYHGPSRTREFFQELSLLWEGEAPPMLVFPPSLSLAAALEAVPPTPQVDVGVQNIHWEEEGAFTGEISAGMAAEAGASHALIGHSERRHIFGETDDEVARKIVAAGTHGLNPVICVGETLEERQAGRLEEVILTQLEAALQGVDRTGIVGLPFLIAYEPVWAIGTGETATPQDASEAHGVLRRRLCQALGEDGGGRIPILYGGSVKPGNARDLLSAPDVDGVLVGGASLNAASFAEIARAARP
jgi:triosephosphate isomerase